MAKSTFHGIHSILSGAFEAAMRWEWTDRNPARSARPPTLSRQTILATSPEAVAKVIAEARVRSAALGLYLWLVVVTGVCRGELCGLQIRDIDLDRGLVHVAFNYVVRGGQRVRKDTKTHQDRWLAMDPDTCALVSNYLKEIRAELAAVGVELRCDAYPFSNNPAHVRPWNPDWATHRSLTPQTRPGWSSTSRAGDTTPPASSSPAVSTCARPLRASATAAAGRPRCGTTPTRSPRWTSAPPPTCTVDRQI
jgi:integrase